MTNMAGLPPPLAAVEFILPKYVAGAESLFFLFFFFVVSFNYMYYANAASLWLRSSPVSVSQF